MSDTDPADGAASRRALVATDLGPVLEGAVGRS